MTVLVGLLLRVGTRPTGRVGSFPLQYVHLLLRHQLFLTGESRIG